MRVTIACVGRARQGPEQALFEDYVGRLPWSVQLKEIEAPKGLSGAKRRQREGRLLLAAVPERAAVVVLDESGRQMTSSEFATRLGAWRDDGRREIAFLVGGAEGHGDAVRARADLILAFGRATWPHLMIRPMLAEQIYRAYTILTSHPYHRV